MSYEYATLRPELFTERGVETLTKVRRNVQKALDAAGVVMAEKAMAGVGGDSWTQLAALDYMVEKGEICEIQQVDYVAGQHRIFRAGR